MQNATTAPIEKDASVPTSLCGERGTGGVIEVWFFLLVEQLLVVFLLMRLHVFLDDVRMGKNGVPLHGVNHHAMFAAVRVAVEHRTPGYKCCFEQGGIDFKLGDVGELVPAENEGGMIRHAGLCHDSKR